MRSIFVAVSGFLGRIESETRCAFWVDEPIEHGFDPSRLITVDLALTPSAAAARRISWDAVQVDDCIARADGNLGGTTMGPRWPELQLVGRVYIEDNYWSKLPAALRSPSRQLTGRAYEYRTAVYWPHIDDPRAGRRYAGHHAEILAEKDTIARVAIYRAGASTQDGARPMMTMWIDLASPDQCDAGPGGLTEIGVGQAPKKGALFLAVGSVRADTQAAPQPGAPIRDHGSKADGAEWWSGPKIPAGIGGSEVDDPVWWTDPKIPAAVGGGEIDDPVWWIEPKIPIATGDSEVEAPVWWIEPKIPIAAGDSEVDDPVWWLTGPKLPWYVGE
jgi:hypothetical protein